MLGWMPLTKTVLWGIQKILLTALEHLSNLVGEEYKPKKRELYKAFKVCEGKICLDLLRMPMILETLPQIVAWYGVSMIRFHE